jgi:hypothetical protein
MEKLHEQLRMYWSSLNIDKKWNLPDFATSPREAVVGGILQWRLQTMTELEDGQTLQ